MIVLAVILSMAWTPSARAQDDADLVDRPIGELLLVGLNRVSERLVTNNLRASVGEPYDPQVVRDDIRRLNSLGEFSFVEAAVELLADGAVRLTYTLQEQQLIAEIQVVDNKLVSDQELRAAVPLFPGGPRDDFLIQKSKRNIKDLYRQRGHYLTEVQVDEQLLDESGILILRIIEGPRVKVRGIDFDGNSAFSNKQLHAEIDTRTALPFLRKGILDEDLLRDDVAAIDRFYKQRGHLDVRVDRTIRVSPDLREATVVFLVDEGPRYTLRSVTMHPPNRPGERLKVFADVQVRAMMELKTGDVYSAELLIKSIRAIEEAYQRLGYMEVTVRPFQIRAGDRPVVDVELDIDEGRYSKVGAVNVKGNFLSKDKLIRRETRLEPGRPIDATEIEQTEKRLRATRLFGEPIRVTIQEPDPREPEYRDVLIEVRERVTGAYGFGIAAGSDSGLFGELTLNQRNFDIADYPESVEEYFSNRSFRGGGQQFNMALRPGNELFQFQVGLTEPRLFDSEVAMSLSAAYLARDFDVYERDQLNGSVGLNRRLGDIWTVGASARVSRTTLDDIDPSAPTEVFQDAGPDTLTGLAVSLTRSTLDRFDRPGSGSRLELSFEQVGLMGGDFDFSNVAADYTTYFTIDEDYLGRLTTIRLNARVGYIFGGRAPIYERYYLGGRSMRGFDFRTVSPKGIQNDTGNPSTEPVGGDWLLFLGAQYEFPVFQDAFSAVVFVDSGTVTDTPGFEDWRASVGLGIRLRIPQFGPVPLAFDIAFPFLKESTDEEQLFSFSAELPFN